MQSFSCEEDENDKVQSETCIAFTGVSVEDDSQGTLRVSGGGARNQLVAGEYKVAAARSIDDVGIAGQSRAGSIL